MYPIAPRNERRPARCADFRRAVGSPVSAQVTKPPTLVVALPIFPVAVARRAARETPLSPAAAPPGRATATRETTPRVLVERAETKVGSPLDKNG